MNNYTYTLGRIMDEPKLHRGKRPFYTVYVELLGGLRVSALCGTVKPHVNWYVCVKVTPKSDGQMAYNIIEIDEAAADFVFDAAQVLVAFQGYTIRYTYDEDERVSVKELDARVHACASAADDENDDDDDEPELPF